MSLFRKNKKSFPETGAPEPRKNPGRSLFAGRPGPFAALLVLSALFLAIPTLVVPGLRAPGLFGSGIFGSGTEASDSETAGPEAASEPRGVLALPMSRDHFLNNLDPASWNGPLVLHMLLYEGLLEEGPDNSVLPSLAESWEISEDGLEYSFRLKEGVKFSDGTPFDAGAAIFNLKRWVNDDMFSSLESHRVESMEETGPFGLKIRFKEAADTILRELAYPRPVRFVAPDHVVVTQDNPKGRVPFPIGTGPFMVESFTLEEFALVPNPHYHGKKPKIAKLEFKVIKDGQARVMALRNGELDIAGGLLFASLPLESLKKLREDSRFRTCLTPSLGSVFMAFNND
ncbi:MAG: ABC transporter substrate-binding protein, partial [Deltaproteobacteria bacterium]|nr:ABC transporter substrate-binding protein [Deltaproteobacteria bacterium]